MLRNNRTYDLLKSKGYRFVAAPASWSGDYDNQKTDISLSGGMDLSEFEDIFLNTTPLGLFIGKQVILNSYRSRLNFTFEHIGDIAALDAPTFIYAHFMMPHPPFVFDADGNPLTPAKAIEGRDGSHYFVIYPDRDAYRKSYIAQLQYANQMTLAMVDKIIDNSPTPPIIIIQGDHGPGSGTDWENPANTDMHERLSILNAYYVPDDIKARLYPAITPVNSFRLVFSGLFGADMPLLPDKSYFATWSHPYDFIDETDNLK